MSRLARKCLLKSVCTVGQELLQQPACGKGEERPEMREVSTLLYPGYVQKGKAKGIKGMKAAMKAVPKAAAKGVMKVVKAKVKAKAKPGGAKLKGKTVCFTGALAIKRSVATSLAKAQGAKVTSSVSKNTASWKVRSQETDSEYV